MCECECLRESKECSCNVIATTPSETLLHFAYISDIPSSPPQSTCTMIRIIFHQHDILNNMGKRCWTISLVERWHPKRKEDTGDA